MTFTGFEGEGGGGGDPGWKLDLSQVESDVAWCSKTYEKQLNIKIALCELVLPKDISSQSFSRSASMSSLRSFTSWRKKNK